MIRDLLYLGSQTRIWAHVETSIKKGKRPLDQSRYPGYDSNDPAGVLKQCYAAKAQGVQAFMYNSYARGSYEDLSRSVYFDATQKAGMGQLINVDGANVTSLSALEAYIAYTKSCIASLPNYECWLGKPIVTYFAKTGNDPAWFAAVEKANPDICFVYNGSGWGKNQMAWIQSDLLANLDWWIRTYGLRKDGSLNIPCVFSGFNDNLNGHSCWNQNEPPRIWPAGVGPNLSTYMQCFQTINKYYSATNPLAFLQLVTWNDWDELTALEHGIPRL